MVRLEMIPFYESLVFSLSVSVLRIFAIRRSSTFLHREIIVMKFPVAGQFTLRDMYEQFQNIMKMGPFSQIMVSSRVRTLV